MKTEKADNNNKNAFSSHKFLFCQLHYCTVSGLANRILLHIHFRFLNNMAAADFPVLEQFTAFLASCSANSRHLQF